MPTVVCVFCSKEFNAKPSWLKRGVGKYCSAKCHHSSCRTGSIVKCFMCAKGVYKTKKALSCSASKKYFCTKSCQTIWRNSLVYVGKSHPNYKEGKYTYRTVLKRKAGNQVCVHCGHEDKRVLAAHHIDENHGNNDATNLAWLCYNCHFLVHHDKVEKLKFLKKL